MGELVCRDILAFSSPAKGKGRFLAGMICWYWASRNKGEALGVFVRLRWAGLCDDHTIMCHLIL